MGKSGDSTTITNTYDKSYNKRMARIAEQQQAQATELYNYYKSTYQPYETAQVEANMSVLPTETALYKSQLESQQSLLPQQTALSSATLSSQLKQVGLSDTAMTKYYDTVLRGVDTTSRVNQARADVEQAYAGADSQQRRMASRYGINPTSPAYQATLAANQRAKAASLAGATTLATTNAEDEQYQRLAGAMGLRSA